MAERAIGIDLGTSNSCVAIRTGDGVSVLPNAFGEHTSASVVSFAEDGSIVVGNAARANVIHDPEYTVSSAKRLIGRYFFSEEVKKAQAICSYDIIEGPNHGVRIQIRNEVFSLPEVSAMVLREMKQLAEASLGEEITKAVITVPAYFNDNQRQATKDAGRIAGLEVLRILNEPTAAALAYGFGKGLDQRVAVYDLGGGTFDISILEIGKDIFEVLATCGDTFLGGDDFDDRIIDLLADEFVAREGINVRNDPYAFEKLKVAAEAAKRGLSLDDSVEIRIPDVLVDASGESRSIERTITSEEFGSLVTDLVRRTFKVCDEALQQADLTVRDLDGVILVGGPTRLPVIRKAVSDYFQQEPRADVDPDEVVAMGAAIHAHSLVSESSDSFLLDVTPLDLRIGVAGGLAEAVIERNTPVPIEQSRSFTTFADDQERVNIRVYQGDSREAQANEMLGEFVFSGFKKARRGDVTIEVTFEINADGIVNVKAFDPDSQSETAMTITLSSGLSDDQLDSIIENNPTARIQASRPDRPAQPAVARAADDEIVALPVDAPPATRVEELDALPVEDPLDGDDLLEGELDEDLDMDMDMGLDGEDLTALDGRALDLTGDAVEVEALDTAEIDTANTDTAVIEAADIEDDDVGQAMPGLVTGNAPQEIALDPGDDLDLELAGEDDVLVAADGGLDLTTEGGLDLEAGTDLEIDENEVIDLANDAELTPELEAATDLDGSDAGDDLFDRSHKDLSAGHEEG